MKSLALLCLCLLPATAFASAAAPLAVPADHYASNRELLIAAWLSAVDAPLSPEAIDAIERVADATRTHDLLQGTAVHAGRMQADCTSPTTGCNLDALTGLPADQCITAQHVGPPGYARHWVTNAATATHSDQLISNHGHKEAYVAGAVCVRGDTTSSNQLRVDGVGVFL